MVYTKAKDIALNLLSYSPRSEQELSNKLKAKGFDKETIAKALDDLSSVGLIDDKRFAVGWARSKLKNRLWGSQKILNGLLEKGIAKETAFSAVRELEDEISEKEIIKRAFEKWMKRQGALGKGAIASEVASPLARNDITPNSNMAKAFRHLISKGFHPSLVNQVLKKHYKDTEECQEPIHYTSSPF